jgi:glycosyltransferase involved in cell wall biosynthesis
MRILIVTQYYRPETGAAQNRLSHLAGHLQAAGHAVTVLTAMPNYPTGEIYEGYQNRLVLDDDKDGMRIIRTWIYTRKSLSFTGRVANYLSFACLAIVFSIWKIGRHDIVIAESPSLFAGMAGLIISRMKSARFILNVSDLWPQSIVDLGLLKNRRLVRLAEWLEQCLYRNANLITGQTQGIVEAIRARVSNPVVLMTNGVDGKRFLGSSHTVAMTYEECANKFVIGYAGLHGLMQDLDTVIEAARLLRDYKDLLFVFYGDGPKKEGLISLAKAAQIDNVRFYASRPADRMPETFASFDVMVVPLRRLAILKGALPCKMFEAMASAVPILLAGEGEAKRLVCDAQCGIVVEPEHPASIVDAIWRLYRSDADRMRFGRNGRQYVLQHYDRDHIHRRFETLLTKVHCRETIESTSEPVIHARTNPLPDSGASS